jgi:hypothetical protein
MQRPIASFFLPKKKAKKAGRGHSYGSKDKRTETDKQIEGRGGERGKKGS